MENKTVMFVDDEKFILRSLKRLFKNEPYTTVFMNSGQEALDYLESNTIDLIISDIRMPEMDGFKLLSAVKEKYPKILRVALSGFTESRTIYKLIEKNVAKLYLFKPWDNFELKENIKGILEFEDVLMDNHLLELINNLDTIPALPSLYKELTDMMDRDVDIEEVGTVIEKDQAISSKVLKLANSAFYGRKTGDLSQAIMGIGLNNLKNIVLTSSFFKGPAEIMDDINHLWEHAVTTNKLTHLIYDKVLNKRIPAIYGSAGLLHDIGKVILHLYYQDSYKTVMDEARKKESDLAHLEIDRYGVTHQDLGAYLLNWWELPFAYVEAAMFHHRPSDSRVINYELVAVVHIANYYSIMKVNEDGTENYLDPMVFSKLEIKKEDVEAVLDLLD
jgi:HD-like signal output (HDOD) protein/CheY-like chemotaxis protein